MLTEDELREMAVSIKEHGQYVACRMDAEGVGLDGRNRVAACALAGVDPTWEPYDGDAIAFIVEVNSERRHLTTGQRAMAVAIGLVANGARKNGKFKRGSVPDNTGTSVGGNRWTDAVRQAGIVMDHAPDLADAVLAGTTKLDAAHKEADEIRQGKARLDAVGGELAALVNTGVIDLAEAERRADEAERIDELDADLAERVRDASVTLDEAETIATERDRRLEAWAEKVRAALITLARMAGHSVPDDLAAKLSDDESKMLTAVVNVLPKGVVNDG